MRGIDLTKSFCDADQMAKSIKKKAAKKKVAKKVSKRKPAARKSKSAQ